ncbi:MAG: CoA pyrophosphatase [Thermoleophilia bacterium]
MTDRETIRARLAAAATRPVDPRRPERGDLPPTHRPPHEDYLPAAVLLGLVGHADGPRIVLTVRTDHLRDHAGQISLPGGRIESTDADPVAAALREAEEETGIDPRRVDILGRLRPYDTITGFHVHPVVGWIDPPMIYTADPFEVAEVFEVPLNFVLESDNHRQESMNRAGRTGLFYVLQYEARRIWGATAGILVDFARVLEGRPL